MIFQRVVLKSSKYYYPNCLQFNKQKNKRHIPEWHFPPVIHTDHIDKWLQDGIQMKRCYLISDFS